MTSLKKNLLNLDCNPKRFINSGCEVLSVRDQCRILGINRSTLYYSPVADAQLEVWMRIIDEAYTKYPFFGTRKMAAYLGKLGHEIGRELVRKVYGMLGLYSLSPGPHTSKGHPEHKKYPYLLRGIEVVRPNQVCSSDITYVRLRRGFVYLAVIMDWFSRYILDWELSTTLDADFCVSLLKRVLHKKKCDIFNTDQGSQYTSNNFVSLVSSHGIKFSMNGKGRCHDNIFNERFWRSYKVEKVYLSDWSTPQDSRIGSAEYMDFYNHVRPHKSLGDKTPGEIYFGN
jgi:putative transposase